MTTGKYIFTLIWPAVVALLYNMTGAKKVPIRVLGKNEPRVGWGWVLLLAIPLIIVAAQRGYFADTTAYIISFRNMPDSLSEIVSYMQTVQKDELFSFVSVLIKVFITKNYEVYLGILATFQMLVLAKIYRKYSTDFFMSMFLFVASTDYISWMFNGLRQFTAVCIILLAFNFILTKKYLFAILIILFASFFHGSALLVIPFIFIVQGKAWNKKTLLFLFGVIIAVAFVDQFTNILDSALADTQYKNVVSDWTQGHDDGTNIFRVLVYSVPAIISLYGKHTIDKADNRLINICTNMSIASAGIYVVSMFTSGIYIGRLPIYFSLFSYILLPWEISHIFSKNSSKLISFILYVCYIGFFCYSLFITWG
ncbi:MAG: EpsG family protein [Clostridia bacterium]|nr:EpsG family protein [Clostridia bacterium]